MEKGDFPGESVKESECTFHSVTRLNSFVSRSTLFFSDPDLLLFFFFLCCCSFLVLCSASFIQLSSPHVYFVSCLFYFSLFLMVCFRWQVSQPFFVFPPSSSSPPPPPPPYPKREKEMSKIGVNGNKHISMHLFLTVLLMLMCLTTLVRVSVLD